MADAKVICLEQARSDRMKPAHFHTIAEADRAIAIHIEGTFSPAAVRVLANAMLERAAAVEAKAKPTT
jgi:hypothetical protein